MMLLMSDYHFKYCILNVFHCPWQMTLKTVEKSIFVSSVSWIVQWIVLMFKTDWVPCARQDLESISDFCFFFWLVIRLQFANKSQFCHPSVEFRGVKHFRMIRKEWYHCGKRDNPSLLLHWLCSHCTLSSSTSLPYQSWSLEKQPVPGETGLSRDAPLLLGGTGGALTPSPP